jgi:hypothetical protein
VPGTTSKITNQVYLTENIFPLVPNSDKAILDSGCTSHLIKPSTPCLHKIPTINGLKVGTANGQTMQASHEATLNPAHLPVLFSPNARQASVLPGLHKSLISLGQLCDHGCDYVLLDKQYASVIQDGVATIIGVRDPSNGMWLVDIAPAGQVTPFPSQHPNYKHVANSVYEQTTKTALIDFLHRTCFSPVISTWIQAIESGFFTTWPGLTAEAVKKYLPKSLATAKGHLKASPKNLRSTKTTPNNTPNTHTIMTTQSPILEPNV